MSAPQATDLVLLITAGAIYTKIHIGLYITVVTGFAQISPV